MPRRLPPKRPAPNPSPWPAINSKLTPALVMEIRARHRNGESVRKIARSLSEERGITVGFKTIHRAVTYELWQRVP